LKQLDEAIVKRTKLSNGKSDKGITNFQTWCDCRCIYAAMIVPRTDVKKANNKILLQWYQTELCWWYTATIDFAKPRFELQMGSVPNVGLMAQKPKNTDLMTRHSKLNHLKLCSRCTKGTELTLKQMTFYVSKSKKMSYSRL
jgi:monomeric isocitrate dehydrogenase